MNLRGSHSHDNMVPKEKLISIVILMYMRWDFVIQFECWQSAKMIDGTLQTIC